MSPVFIPLEHSRKKFYQRENCSKKFFELSPERLAEIAKLVYKKQEINDNMLSRSSERFLKLDRYQKTLQYLTNPYIHLELGSFDERMAYLIMMCDPNLVTFKEFLKLDLISISEISNIENKDERNHLMLQREQTIAAYETAVRDKIGFFDTKLLKYEEMFFRNFFSEKELITEVGINSQNTLMKMAKSFRDFNSISDERYEHLINLAQCWLSYVSEENNSKTAAYSVMNQKKLLGLDGLDEQLTLFILLVDSNLDMLRIYEEESRMPNVERRITEQFGYYNEELLILEKKFHARFCPEKELSIWTKVKKD